MEIRVFGTGCSRCDDAARVVAEAVRQSGRDISVIKVKDFKEMMSYGVISTPAVAVDRKVMCTGRVPSCAEVLAWLTA